MSVEGDGRGGFSMGDWIFVVGLAAAAILVPALVLKVHFQGEVESFQWSLQTIGGLVAAALALVLVGFNLHVCFLRAWLHKRRTGALDDLPNVSGGPLLSGIFLFFAAFLLPASPVAGAVLLLLYLSDPCGLHVAAGVFLREVINGHPRAD